MSNSALDLAAAATAGPRLAPVGKAVALLGIGSLELAGRKFTIEGRRVQFVRFGRLALGIAFVDRADYAEESLAQRRADAKWLATEARIHERAVERASALAAIVPTRLLTVYDDTERLTAFARVHYARWHRSLARLGGKREYVVRAYRGPHLPPSAAQPYLVGTTAHAVRGARTPSFGGDESIAGELHAWWTASARIALGARRLDAPPARGELFSGVLLASADAGEALAKIGDERTAAAALGIAYYVEGPRAPFSFV